MTRFVKVRRHQNPNVYDIDFAGDLVASISIEPGSGRVPSLMVDQALDVWNGEHETEPVPAGAAHRDRLCRAAGWASAEQYDAARDLVGEYVADEPPEVLNAIRQAWKNAGHTDHILTRGELAEWETEVARICDAYRAQETAA